jgi:hypothetical protein
MRWSLEGSARRTDFGVRYGVRLEVRGVVTTGLLCWAETLRLNRQNLDYKFRYTLNSRLSGITVGMEITIN